MNAKIMAVLTTVPDENIAASIAKSLVEEHRVACVNIIPRIRSIYRWKDQIEDESELLLVCKTNVESVDGLIQRICTLHPYSVPEAIALPVVAGHSEYIDWVISETKMPQS
jgi:periplasmic divalent cation tolerance protein